MMVTKGGEGVLTIEKGKGCEKGVPLISVLPTDEVDGT
jgi:hypothetical protein